MPSERVRAPRLNGARVPAQRVRRTQSDQSRE
jgi:hypothetical protein